LEALRISWSPAIASVIATTGAASQPADLASYLRVR